MIEWGGYVYLALLALPVIKLFHVSTMLQAEQRAARSRRRNHR